MDTKVSIIYKNPNRKPYVLFTDAMAVLGISKGKLCDAINCGRSTPGGWAKSKTMPKKFADRVQKLVERQGGIFTGYMGDIPPRTVAPVESIPAEPVLAEPESEGIKVHDTAPPKVVMAKDGMVMYAIRVPEGKETLLVDMAMVLGCEVYPWVKFE